MALFCSIAEFNSTLIGSCTMTKWDSSLGCYKDSWTYTTQLVWYITLTEWRISPHNNLTMCRKSLTKFNSLSWLNKKNQQIDIRRTYFNKMKAAYQDPILIIILNGEKLRAFLLESEISQRWPLLTFLLRNTATQYWKSYQGN